MYQGNYKDVFCVGLKWLIFYVLLIFQFPGCPVVLLRYPAVSCGFHADPFSSRFICERHNSKQNYHWMFMKFGVDQWRVD